MEDAVHCNSNGLVVGVDRFWVVRRACWVASLRGGQKGFDSFVSEDRPNGWVCGGGSFCPSRRSGFERPR